MPIVINGSGSITGISAGGLPDGCVTADDLASGVGGKMLQVVQTTKTDAFTTTSATPVDVTGLTASITPSNSSNKVLVTVSLGTFNSQHELKRAMLNIVRDSTNVLVGDADTGAEVTAITCTRSKDGNGAHIQVPFSYSVLDSPSTTSSTTYKIQVFTLDGGTVSVNRPGTRDAYSGNTACALILREVAA